MLRLAIECGLIVAGLLSGYAYGLHRAILYFDKKLDEIRLELGTYESEKEKRRF